MSTLKYFRNEYLSHVVDKKCKSKICQGLKMVIIEPEKCKACTKCLKVCPVDAIEGKIKVIHHIDQSKCIKCSACIEACPFDAIKEEF